MDLPIAADQLDPEATLIEREAADVVAEIYKLLEGDDEAQLTIMAIVDGKKGKELRDEDLCLQRAAGWADRCLRDIVNLMSRQRRKDWHSVRKGACVWIFRRCEGAARQTLSPGGCADPGLASVRGLDWRGPNRRREGCIHVHQIYRYAACSTERRSPA